MITVSAEGERAERVAWKVHDLLAEEQVFRTTTSDILIEARDGSLHLKGRVRTNILRKLAQQRAQMAINGWQLENELISDEGIALSLASKLAMDPRTAAADIHLEVFFGTVYLKGTVHNQDQRAAATELARKEPGVTNVVDHLVLRS